MTVLVGPGPRILPPEITDKIIAQVWPDTNTLSTCALVCSAWLTASRYHLYRKIVLRHDKPERYQLLIDRVLRSETSASLLTLLHHLVVKDCDDVYIELRIPVQHKPRFPIRTFAVHFVGLPNLQTLELEGDWRIASPHPRSFLSLSMCSSVKHLNLNYCAFPSFGVLRHILTNLPSLTHLRMEIPAITWPRPSPALSPLLLHGVPQAMRPRLESLALTGRFPVYENGGAPDLAQQLVAWLSATSASLTLRSCLHWALQCPGSPAGRHCNVPACTISGPHAHFSCPQK